LHSQSGRACFQRLTMRRAPFRPGNGIKRCEEYAIWKSLRKEQYCDTALFESAERSYTTSMALEAATVRFLGATQLLFRRSFSCDPTSDETGVSSLRTRVWRPKRVYSNYESALEPNSATVSPRIGKGKTRMGYPALSQYRPRSGWDGCVAVDPFALSYAVAPRRKSLSWLP
jgi:hypothetical protein